MSAIGSVLFIGLGQMGVPMARNLAAAGFQVTGCDLSEAARAAAEAEGVHTVESAAAAGAVDAVVTMLPNGGAVRAALLGPDGALAKKPLPHLVVDMSSCAPTDTVALGSELVEMGVELVDAPVSGGRTKAVEGTLTIMVGGADAPAGRARPLFEAMGARIFACGGLGAGHATKALNNYVSGAGAVAAMEAVIVGRDFGLDPEVLVDVLNVSTGRNNTTEAKMKQFVLSRDFGSGFGMALMAKDIGIAADLARSRNLRLPLLPEMSTLWSDAAGALGEGADHTEMFRFLEDGSE